MEVNFAIFMNNQQLEGLFKLKGPTIRINQPIGMCIVCMTRHTNTNIQNHN